MGCPEAQLPGEPGERASQARTKDDSPSDPHAKQGTLTSKCGNAMKKVESKVVGSLKLFLNAPGLSLLRDANGTTAEAQSVLYIETCCHAEESTSLAQQCAELSKKIAAVQKSETDLKAKLERLTSLDTNNDIKQQSSTALATLNIPKPGNISASASASASTSAPASASASPITPLTGQLHEFPRDPAYLSARAALRGARPSNTSNALTHPFQQLGVRSAAPNGPKHWKNASGLEKVPHTSTEFHPGDLVKAFVSAVALDTRPECDPKINVKFVQANGSTLQACERRCVVVQCHQHSMKVIPLESAGGNGASQSRMHDGTVIGVISHNNQHTATLSLRAFITGGNYPVSPGTFIDLVQDRPVNFKEKITKVGYLLPEDTKHLMRAWHFRTGGEKLSHQLELITTQNDQLASRAHALTDDMETILLENKRLKQQVESLQSQDPHYPDTHCEDRKRRRFD